MPTPPHPIHGELGVLRDDGERVQCHVCGEWYLHLGVHTNAAHGLTADAYRQRFGLMSKTKLGGPAWLAMLRETKSEHIASVYSPRRERVKTMTTEERRAEQANREWRAEHERHKTPPERMRAPLKAKYGTETGYPDEFIRHMAELFVQELQNGQRGVYGLGERMGTDWSTARSRVMIAAKRWFLVWRVTHLLGPSRSASWPPVIADVPAWTLGLEEFDPGAVVLDVALESAGCFAGVVIALHLPVVRDEVEHAQIARHLQFVRKARAVVEAARLGVVGDGTLHSASRALRTE